MKNILLAGGILDMYVNRKKYESYKRDNSKRNYIERKMNELFNSIIGTCVNEVTIRSISVTPNNFWGNKTNIIPDIGYSCNNIIPSVGDDSDEIPIRLFMVDIVGVMDDSVKKEDLFFKIKDSKYILTVSNIKIV